MEWYGARKEKTFGQERNLLHDRKEQEILLSTPTVPEYFNLTMTACPYRHGMANPQVAGGKESLQISGMPVKILSNQSRIAENGCSSSLGFDLGVNNFLP
jgi:hypothetical protein